MKKIFGLLTCLAAISTLAAKTHTEIKILQHAPFNTSCKVDADCVPAPGCCPSSCVSLVINKADLEKANAALHCPKEAKCSSESSCQTHEYLCIRKTCKIVYSKDRDFRPQR